MYAQNLLSWVKKANHNLVVAQKSMSVFILKMYLHDRLVQRSQYHLKQFPQLEDDLSKCCDITPMTLKLPQEEQLLSYITLVDQDDIFDTLCVRHDLSVVIQLLIECSNGKAFKEQPRIVQDSVQDASWFDRNAPQPTLFWIINELEKQITLLYYKHVNYINHEYLLNYWANEKTIRGRVLNSIQNLSKKSLQYSGVVRDHTINQQEITDKFTNNELESIFYMPIERTLCLQSFCEKQVLKLIKENYKQSLLKELENEQLKTPKKKKKYNKQKKQVKVDTDTEEECALGHKKQIKQEELPKPMEVEIIEPKSEPLPEEPRQLSQESQQETQTPKKPFKKSLQLPKQDVIEIIDTSVMDQAYQSMIKKLDMDMKEFTEQIMRGNEAQFPIRQIVFQRLQYIVQMLFPEANIRLFGSCATGLTLPDSDIDVGITGFEMCVHRKMDILIESMSKMNWIKKIKPIYQNTLPLIKLQVDPSITYNQINIACESQLISVDISFFDHFQHLGLTSTELTCYWLSTYQELRPITLLFKSLLKRRGLNDQSRGGISSFCLVLMVVSFLEHFYQGDHSYSLGFTTYKFLQFYGMKFDPCSQGIFYRGFDQSPFYPLERSELQLTIVSPITYEIISQSSSFVQTILQDIQVLYLACEHETQFFYEKMKFNRRKRGKKEDRNLFYKELAKLNPLFST